MPASRFQPKSILFALLISYLLSGIFLLLLSLAVWKMQLSEQTTGVLIFAVYALSCFAGGFTCARLIRSRRFFWGLLTGLLYVLILTAVSQIFGSRETAITENSSSHLLQTVICCAVSGMIGGIAG
ncbi:TIGR04086 family membrane protein [Brotaphodocola sp.]|uniref:TIGR04086 family membrane protein n=1 Tax=Brotaphodocola sp. TaxID=3073577 RepID=UPI003D7C81CC